MPKILILDEKPGVRRVFERGLASEYQVMGIGDAEILGDSIRSYQPDLVIADLFFHGKDRWDLLPAIEKVDSRLPILLVTSSENYLRNPLLSLCAGVLVKSFFFDDLKKKIVDILKRNPGASLAGATPIPPQGGR